MQLSATPRGRDYYPAIPMLGNQFASLVVVLLQNPGAARDNLYAFAEGFGFVADHDISHAASTSMMRTDVTAGARYVFLG